jgi:manganese/zinc/iron transport system substrate-binding protein
MKSIARSTIVLAVMTLASCGGGAPEPADGFDLKVVATTNIVADLVRTVGGPRVEVEALMGPGIDPHLYKASAGDVRRMSSAEAIFYSGLHLEGKMSEVLERMGVRGARTVAVAECVPEEDLIESADFSGLHDPHVWFDVALWSQAADCVAETLGDIDPGNRAEYHGRAAASAEKLEARYIGHPGAGRVHRRTADPGRLCRDLGATALCAGVAGGGQGPRVLGRDWRQPLLRLAW